MSETTTSRPASQRPGSAARGRSASGQPRPQGRGTRAGAEPLARRAEAPVDPAGTWSSGHRESRARGSSARSTAFARRAFGAIVLAGLGATIGLAVSNATAGGLALPGGPAMFAGNLAALAGTYLAMVMVLLMSRIPFVERAVGLDGLVRWHRRLSPWPLSLIALHAVLTTIGYAQAAKSGVWKQLGAFVDTYPDMLAAIVGFGIMMAIGVVSIRAIRARLRRETWWAIHLYMYLALALSFAHQIVLGPAFVGHPLTVAVWSLAWASTAGLVIAYRVGLPIVRTLRHRLRVVAVREEAPGVTSVVLEGRRLERLQVAGGQFFAWRFLAKGMWWQAHPYSMSALPSPPYLRLTVKQVGDHSSAVGRLRPGTRVAIEGPYGRFTRDSRVRDQVALFAGGIGVTALRALLEDLPGSSRPVVVVRASTEEELVLREELAELVRERRGQLHELVGSRSEVRLDRQLLRRLVPDLRKRDAFVCGPESFVEHTVALLRAAGLEPSRIHHEAFSL